MQVASKQDSYRQKSSKVYTNIYIQIRFSPSPNRRKNMSTGYLIINTPKATFKTINRLLLHLRDWQYGEDPHWDCQAVLFSIDDANLPQTHYKADQGDEKILQPTIPPIQPPLPVNQWSGLSIPEIEKILLLKQRSLVLLLDDEGMRTETIIIAEHAMDDDVDPESTDVVYLPEYNKVRVPWDQAYIIWCNLDIANMSFGDYCVEHQAPRENGFWWTYDGADYLEDDRERIVARREGVIRELERLDLA